MFGEIESLAILALCACSPLLIHTSQHALIDGVCGTCALLALWTLWESMRERAHPVWLAAFAISFALLVLSKENSAFPAAGFVALLLLGPRINFGQRYSEPYPGETLLAQMVGTSVEQSALKDLDPTSAYGTNGQTVQDRINQLTQQRTDIRSLVNQSDQIYPTLSEQDWISYLNRSATFGEEAALRWLVSKHGAH